MASSVRIASIASYLPPRVETADDLAPRLGKSADWIRLHTGVAERRVADESVESMAAKAVRKALGDGPPPDLLINASTTPRQAIPDTAPFVLRELGWTGMPAFTVHATCLSFLAASDLVANLVSAGRYRRVVVVSSEIASTSRRWTEPESASLLGDGAAAAVFEATPPGEASEWRAFEMATYPEGVDFARIDGCGVRLHPANPASRPEDALFTMNGPKLFKMTAKLGAPLFERVRAASGFPIDAIDWFVPHQASGPGLRVLRLFGIPDERVVSVVGNYGNCIAASIPIALATAVADGRVKRGDKVALLGTGAGLSVAAAIVVW